MAAAASAAALVLAAAAPAPASVPVVPADRVGSLSAAADGGVWFTLDGRLGVGVLRADATSTAWPLPGGAERATVSAERAGGAWALVPSERGSHLFRVGARGPRRAATLTGFAAELAVDDRTTWIGGHRGLWTIRDGRPQRVARGTFGALAPAAAGGVWALRERRAAGGAVHTALERWTRQGRASTVRLHTRIGADDVADDGRGGVWTTSILEPFFRRVDPATGRSRRVDCPACGMVLSLTPAPRGGALAFGWGDDDRADLVVGLSGDGARVVLRGRLSSGRPLAALPDGRIALGEARAAHLTLLAPDGARTSVRVDLPVTR